MPTTGFLLYNDAHSHDKAYITNSIGIKMNEQRNKLEAYCKLKGPTFFFFAPFSGRTKSPKASTYRVLRKGANTRASSGSLAPQPQAGTYDPWNDPNDDRPRPVAWAPGQGTRPPLKGWSGDPPQADVADDAGLTSHAVWSPEY